MAICGGCDHPIFDRYLFHVLDKPWHAACICCNDCKAPLADKCFSRDGILLCKDDFTRRFGTKCAGCDRLVDKNDLVRRARDKVFHVDCFCCTVCQKRLDTGEELYILNGNRFICKQDYMSCRPGGSDCGSDEVDDDDGGSDDMALKAEVDLAVMGLTELSPSGAVTPTQQRSDSQQSGGGDSGNTNTSGKGGQSQDENSAGAGTKRRGPRTTIKAKQLETLKAAFAATPKPTRHIREQLAQETGLNMRVIQVWFQNRRSKERRMKQLRYGGFRPGRRNRSSMQRDEMIGPAMFQDGMGRPGDPYFQPPIGFYCDMYGQEGPPPHPQDMPLPPPGAAHAAFLLSAQDESGMLAAAAHLDAHQPPNDGSYMMDEGMRPPHSSPNMPLGAQDETFRVLHGFHQTSQELKTETSVPPGW